jgi:hypothetical protein
MSHPLLNRSLDELSNGELLDLLDFVSDAVKARTKKIPRRGPDPAAQIHEIVGTLWPEAVKPSDQGSG